MKLFPFRLSLITDFSLIADNDIETMIGAALAGGVDLVQFRDHRLDISPQRRRELAGRVRGVTNKKKVPLIINGDINLMREVDGDGVQVRSSALHLIPLIRKEIGPNRYIGASVHNREELLLASKFKADFLLLSPLFPPGSKPGVTSSLGEEKFRTLCSLTTIPVVALGGINISNVEVPISCGASGVSMITGLLGEDDIYQAARIIQKKIVTVSHI